VENGDKDSKANMQQSKKLENCFNRVNLALETAKDFLNNVGNKMLVMGEKVIFFIELFPNIQKFKDRAGDSFGTVKGSLGNIFTKFNSKWQEGGNAQENKKDIDN